MKTSLSIDVLHGWRQSSRMGQMIILSLVLHVLAISGMFLLPNLASSRILYSPVYSVRLVSPAPTFGPVGEVLPVPSIETQPLGLPPAMERPKAKEKEKPISLSAAKKEDPEKKIAEAIERIRKRQEAKSVDTAIESIRQRQESKSIDTVIERLRSEKEARQLSSAIEGIRKRVTIGSAGAIETGERATGGASSGVMSIKFKLYYNLLWQRIRSVWVLPEEALGGKKDLETIMAIRIAKDGQIEDIQFEKKSGNPYLDESALRAIKKANPLPPLPPGMEGDKFDLGVRFKPSNF